jgi:hypothetical protein
LLQVGDINSMVTFKVWKFFIFTNIFTDIFDVLLTIALTIVTIPLDILLSPLEIITFLVYIILQKTGWI